MSDDDIDLDSLRQQTSQGDRLDEAANNEATQEFINDIIAELEAIEDGEQQKTVSIWDGPMAAFIRALEDNPDRLDAVGQALQEQADLEEIEIDRSEVLRLALRLGFQTAAPENFEAVRDAIQEHSTKRL
jgi:hypothetical protein